jgi:hypothetical protein
MKGALHFVVGKLATKADPSTSSGSNAAGSIKKVLPDPD